MMKANELRIGNYVSQGGNTTQVDLINYNQVIATEWGLIELKFINPIPLTKEWMVKFGFEIDDSEWFKDDDEIVYQKTYKDFSICVSNKGVVYNGIYRQKIKHVHTLQNLYFALTGEELTIKN